MPGQAHPALETLDARTRMVMRQLAGRGIRDQRVLAAMRWVPREWFLPPHLAAEAYSDAPLPIGNGQTISQPYVVALMTRELAPRRSDRILEIGTGSGYQTAVLSHLVPSGKIFTIERLPDLLVEAEERFRRLGLTNVETQLADGAQGWPEQAPFNGIIVAAAAPRIPGPLVAQLAPGGRLVIPIGDLSAQELVILERPANGGAVQQRRAGGVRFVPLISRLAFTEER
jgi:protein-L-isoaspartate(D-aspartate) O-methyltransferase